MRKGSKFTPFFSFFFSKFQDLLHRSSYLSASTLRSKSWISSKLCKSYSLSVRLSSSDLIGRAREKRQLRSCSDQIPATWRDMIGRKTHHSGEAIAFRAAVCGDFPEGTGTNCCLERSREEGGRERERVYLKVRQGRGGNDQKGVSTWKSYLAWINLSRYCTRGTGVRIRSPTRDSQSLSEKVIPQSWRLFWW